MASACFGTFGTSLYIFWNYFYLAEDHWWGSSTRMRIWSILWIKSVLKWWILYCRTRRPLGKEKCNDCPSTSKGISLCEKCRGIYYDLTDVNMDDQAPDSKIMQAYAFQSQITNRKNENFTSQVHLDKKQCQCEVKYRSCCANYEASNDIARRGTHIDHQVLHAVQVLEFDLEEGEEEEQDIFKFLIVEMITLNDKILVLHFDDGTLKIYNQSGIHMKYAEGTPSCEARGMTKVNENEFALCYDYSIKLCKLSSEMNLKILQDFPLKHKTSAIRFNETYFCILHCNSEMVTILDKDFKEVRTIKVNKDTKGIPIETSSKLHCDRETHDIYIALHIKSTSVNYGILCMSIEGDAKWFTLCNGMVNAITSFRGLVCVANDDNACVVLMTRDAKVARTLLDNHNSPLGLGSYPYHVYFDDCTQALFVHTAQRMVHLFKVD